MKNLKPKKQEVSDEEQLEILIEEIRAIISESVFSARMTLIEAKHLVGKTIAQNRLYKKSKKGAGDVIRALAKSINRSGG